MIKFCTTLPSKKGLILALKKAKISPFFEGRVVQNLIKHREEKIIFQQNVFYFVKLFESSLKIYFGPLGTSWGLRNHFGSQKELKKVQSMPYRAFFGGVIGNRLYQIILFPSLQNAHNTKFQALPPCLWGALGTCLQQKKVKKTFFQQFGRFSSFSLRFWKKSFKNIFFKKNVILTILG